MAEHTPGPWKAVQCEQGPPGARVPDPNEWRVNAPNERLPAFKICNLTRETSDESLEANANLIAAAPELLAALEHWFNFIETSGSDVTLAAVKPWTGKMHDAIAKARGDVPPRR